MKFKDSMIELQQQMDRLVKPGEEKGIVAFACDGTTGKKPVYCVNLSGKYEFASMAIARVLCGNLPVSDDQRAVLYTMLRAAFGWFVKNAPDKSFLDFIDIQLLDDLSARFDEIAKRSKKDHQHAESK